MAVAHTDDDWMVEDVLKQDGTKLSLSFAAARFGDRSVMGSPFSDGILVCQMED